MFVLTVRNNTNPKAIDASFTLGAYLDSQGIEHLDVNSSDLYASDSTSVLQPLGDTQIDLAVVLGGDGTILRTARLLKGRSTEILGINFGHLGFLANSSESGVLPLVAKAFAGELVRDSRCNLRVDVECEPGLEPGGFLQSQTLEGINDGIDRDGIGGRRTFFALNEVSITRGAMGRVLDFKFDISDVDIAAMSGDGVIVASATGSTGYALAAGSPLVAPTYSGLIVQPLAPHSLTARAVLTDRNDIVHVRLDNERSKKAATLFTDGDMLLFNEAVSDVYVRVGDVPTTLLYEDRDHFYKYSAKTFF